MRILALLFLLAACAEYAPPPNPVARPIAPGSSEPLRFTELHMGSMRRNMEIGRYVWGIDCAGPYGRLFWATAKGFREANTFTERFNETMADAGYDVAGGRFFDAKEDGERARYIIAGDLQEIRLELCRRRSWITLGERGDTGYGTVKIAWAVYEPVERRVVYRVTTTGSTTMDAPVPNGEAVLIEDAFSTAVEALAADDGFRAAMMRGAPSPALPVSVPVSMGGASPGPVPPVESMPSPAPLAVNGAAPFRGMLEDHGTAIANAIVRVGGGRGIVIGEANGRSFLLAGTAAVGPDATVAVQPGRGVTLEGTVLRRDPRSGLALLRVPAKLTALPVRRVAPEVSDPVHAVLREGEDYASGIVGGRQDELIQADLDGAGPAPGDPLLDDRGALAGLAVAGPALRGPAGHGLSAFVPVGDALKALGVIVTAGRA